MYLIFFGRATKNFVKQTLELVKSFIIFLMIFFLVFQAETQINQEQYVGRKLFFISSSKCHKCLSLHITNYIDLTHKTSKMKFSSVDVVFYLEWQLFLGNFIFFIQ